MRTTAIRTPVVIGLIGSLVLSVCGGCASLQWHPIYNAALGGALIGWIIGHQSNEDGEGAALGAAIAATGCLLEQIDKSSKEEKVVVEVTNENGSITPVVLKKKASVYTGPKGEHYDKRPSEEQLRPLYGK
ncbi:MAG: hypothetical protein MUO33_11735 [Sedimentisphaerales bacterium]|nr:hypothetical protein [Sedimentisphaerales bacterium]